MGKLLFTNVKNIERAVFWNMLARGYELDFENPIDELSIEGDVINCRVNPAPKKIDIQFSFSSGADSPAD